MFSLVLPPSFFLVHITLAILRLLAARRHRPLAFLPHLWLDRSSLESLRLLTRDLRFPKLHNLNWRPAEVVRGHNLVNFTAINKCQPNNSSFQVLRFAFVVVYPLLLLCLLPANVRVIRH